MSQIIRDINELTPRMQDKVTAFLKECDKQGLDCHVFESYRSQERQDELYAQGRTKPGNIVTWTTDSRHKQREAVDMAFGGDGKWNWNGDWDKMITIAKKFGLESLAPREMAHLQDDGTEYNQNNMSQHDYKKMSGDIEEPVLNDLSGDNTLTEGEIKALINIGVDRAADKIADKVLEKFISRLANN